MKSPLKLLQIGKHYHPDTGGIETVTRDLSEALPRHGVDADILCLGYKGKTYPPLLMTEYEVARAAPLAQFGNKVLSLDYIRRLRALQPRYDAALLHVPNPLGVLGALTYWRKPLFLLWHADIPQPRLAALSSPFDEMLIKRAAAVIAPTPAHAHGSRHAAAILPKHHVAPYAFSTDRLAAAWHDAPPVKALAQFAAGKRIVLSVGRLVPYKGFDILIEAAQMLVPDACVVIVGGGELENQLRGMIEARGLAKRVMLLGEVEDAALSACYERAHIVCMPSVTAAEMYGMVQVEAMAHGKPVVSTNIPKSGVPYVNRHGETGLVVEPGNATALASALNSILSSPAVHAQLSQGAAARFRDDHDFEKSGFRYASIIREALMSSRAAQSKGGLSGDHKDGMDVLHRAGTTDR